MTEHAIEENVNIITVNHPCTLYFRTIQDCADIMKTFVIVASLYTLAAGGLADKYMLLIRYLFILRSYTLAT